MGTYSGDSGALCALKLMRALFEGILRRKASGVFRSGAFSGAFTKLARIFVPKIFINLFFR